MFSTLSGSISILRLLQQQLRKCQSARQWGEAGRVHLGFWQIAWLAATAGNSWWSEYQIKSCHVFPSLCPPLPAPPGEAVHLISSDSGHSAKQCASRARVCPDSLSDVGRCRTNSQQSNSQWVELTSCVLKCFVDSCQNIFFSWKNIHLEEECEIGFALKVLGYLTK